MSERKTPNETYLDANRLTNRVAESIGFVTKRSWLAVPSSSELNLPIQIADKDFIPVDYSTFHEALRRITPDARLDEPSGVFWEDRYLHSAGVGVTYGNMHTLGDKACEYLELRSVNVSDSNELARKVGLIPLQEIKN